MILADLIRTFETDQDSGLHKTRKRPPTPAWAFNLADEINNKFELGLSDAQANSLARLIYRRANTQ